MIKPERWQKKKRKKTIFFCFLLPPAAAAAEMATIYHIITLPTDRSHHIA